MTRAVAALAVLLALSSIAHAAEQRMILDWAELTDVANVVGASPPAGRRVSVFGYPICAEPRQCVLFGRPGQAIPQLPFSAAALEASDRTRLIRCADHGRFEPCMAVLYGTTRRGGGMDAARIFWRSFE